MLGEASETDIDVFVTTFDESVGVEQQCLAGEQGDRRVVAPFRSRAEGHGRRYVEEFGGRRRNG